MSSIPNFPSFPILNFTLGQDPRENFIPTTNPNSERCFNFVLSVNHILSLNHTRRHFLFRQEVMLSDDFGANFLRPILIQAGVREEEPAIDAVVSTVVLHARRMSEDPLNAGVERLNIFLNINESVIFENNDHESINRAIRDSMEDAACAPQFKPASKTSIEGLKKIKFDGERILAQEQCMICLEELLADSEITSLPCGHLFHVDCVVRWLERSHVCPLCRYSMPE